MRQRRFCWLLLLVLMSACLGARAAEDDPTQREYLLGINLKGNLSKNWSWSIEQAAYWDAEHTLRTYAPQLGLAYKVNNWLALGAAVRLLREKDDDEVIWTRKRATGDIALQWPASDWKLSYRLRWQGEWRDSEDKGTPRRFYLRNRVQLKYAGWAHWLPYVSAETYHRVDEGQKTTGVEKSRYTLGSELPFARHHALDLYLRQQVPFNDDPVTRLIGLEYTYSFK